MSAQHRGLRAKVEGRGRIIAAGASIAAVLALVITGSATADRDGRDQVTSPEIKDGGVYSPDLHDGAIRSVDLRDGGVHLSDLSPWLRESIAGSCTSAIGADFALNSGDTWTVSGEPFAERAATAVVDGNRTGRVHLATYPNGAYADAGVIVPLGIVGGNFDAGGNLIVPKVRGPYTNQTAINLYVDGNGDGKYLEFDEDGVYVGKGGDEILFSVDESTQRGGIAAQDTALMWAWVGISGSHAQTAALTKVGGDPLTVC